MYILGIDAGGTKCSARLTDEGGSVIGTGISGPANISTGIENVFAQIMAATHSAMDAAGLKRARIGDIRAGIGVAGLGRHGALAALSAQPFAFRSVRINNDAFIANIGAHGGADGGIVIVGTGSIAIGRVGGRDIRVGGYGFPISDEGSGAYVGLQAIRLTLRAADGRLAYSGLTQEIFKHHGRDIQAIVKWMDTARANDYAALAPLVMKSAMAGDAHGREIIASAARHVEQLIQSLFAAGVERCALFGGLSQPLSPWLPDGVRNRLVDPDGDALDGALWFARQPQ